MINRDDQIARLNKDIADLQEQLSRKDSSLKNLDHELRNAQEDRRNVEDSVSLDMNQVLKTQKIWNESFVFLLYRHFVLYYFVCLYHWNCSLEFQLSRREISIQQYDVDLAQVKQQYREAVEENGRLEARIQAFAINAQSEQDVLSSEVKKA